MASQSLTDAELACLRRLARDPDAHQACSQLVLDELLVKGLVEKQPSLGLPVLPQRGGYHLTAAGRRALEAAEGC
jgi:hypothetical protein